ncbi:MAG: DUF2914 domain-containing protein [bacterium]|nr:DUF2914 domain-containing protein [bacterium]
MERPLSSLSLVGGFVFDAITLKRVDTFWENFWIIAHLVGVAICIIFIHLTENEAEDGLDAAKAHFWFLTALQFFFGGLLSVFLVFYFRSGTLAASWPFLLMLAVAFIANERLKKHYERLSFQISFFFLSIFSFAVFIVPVLAHEIGPAIFLLSGIASVVIILVFILALGFFAKEKFKKSKKMIALSIGGIFVSLNLLYFLNLIPPIPLSLSDAGVYHALARNADGNYAVLHENRGGGLKEFFDLYEDVHLVPGAPLYVYSAIFSPAELNTGVTHVWQHYDETRRRWVTSSLIPLAVVGGREAGFRTYSLKTGLRPGRWRVNVETSRGAIIGRVNFKIVPVDTEPPLVQDIKK